MRLRVLDSTIQNSVLMVLLATAALAYGSPKVENVRTSFLEENPTFTVTAVGTGEGDGGAVYMHIRYRRPGSTTECEVVWGYRQAKPQWSRFYKGEPGLAGTVCEGCVRKPCV